MSGYRGVADTGESSYRTPVATGDRDRGDGPDSDAPAIGRRLWVALLTLALAAVFLTALGAVGPAAADDGGTATDTDPANESFFAVEITDTAVDIPDDSGGPLAEGNLTVEYTVENTGEAADTQDIVLSVEGFDVASEEVTLEPGESVDGTFELDGADGPPGAFDEDATLEFTVAVSSEDDTDETTVTIGPDEGIFEVTNLTAGDAIEGEHLDVTVAVTNTGNASESQQVAVEAGALGETSTFVALAPDESTERTVSFPTESGDAGNYTVTATTGDDNESIEATVLPGDGDEAFFAVEIDNVTIETPDLFAESPFDLGLAVEYTVENTGNASDTQDIALSVEDVPLASQEVGLAPGETDTRTFELGSASALRVDDDGEGEFDLEFTVAVSSEDDTDEANVTIGPEGPEFEVTDLTVPDVVAGEDLDVTVEVTNTGEFVGLQEVSVGAGGLGEASTFAVLDAGESAEKTLSLPTAPGDAGTYNVTAATDDDNASTEATVLPGDGDESFFAVNITGTELDVPDDGPLYEASLTVEYTVENTGEAADAQDIVLTIEGIEVDSEELGLEPGESADSTFELGGSGLPPASLDGEAFEFTVAVSSEDDTDEANVTVGEGEATFEVTGLTAADTVEGETLTVALGVTNTGNASGTQTVDVAAGDLGEESLTVALAANESTERTVAFPTESGDAGNYTVTATTESDEASTEVTVLPGAGNGSFFAVNVTGAEADLPDDPGEPPAEAELTVEYTVENTGDAADTQAVVLIVEGVEADSETVSLEPGEAHSGTFEYAVTPPPLDDTDAPCEPGEPCGPEVNVTVASEDDSDQTTVVVDPVGPPPALVGNPPQDLNGDGLYRDVTGDGTADIFDVQALFTHLDTPAVQNHAAAFDFAGSGATDSVSIFDVQALFDDVTTPGVN